MRSLDFSIKALDEAIARDFGLAREAKVETTQRYNTTYNLDQFKKTLNDAVSIVNKDPSMASRKLSELKSVIASVKMDFDADLKNKNLDPSKTKEHYEKYKKAASDVSSKFSDKAIQSFLRKIW